MRQRLLVLRFVHYKKLKVLACVDGDFRVERAIHGKFRHLRLFRDREWFIATKELREFVKQKREEQFEKYKEVYGI